MALVATLQAVLSDFSRLVYTLVDNGADAATATMDPNVDAIAASWLDGLFETVVASDAAAVAVMQRAQVILVPRVMASNGTLAVQATNNAGRTRLTATAGAVRGANTWDLVISRPHTTQTTA